MQVMSRPPPEVVRQVVGRVLGRVLPRSEPRACPYLPGRTAQVEAVSAAGVDAEGFDLLLGLGFRREGHVLYRPCCARCRECRSLRVPVALFQPTRSQRRVWRRNADVHVEVGPPRVTRRKGEMYRAYLNSRHDGAMSRGSETLRDGLYCSPVETLEATYRVGRRLVGVSILDVAAEGLSSVYMFFDPAESRRSLGTFSVLWEIDYCRRLGKVHYHLGFWVPEAKTMAYKARFGPCEVLDEQRDWVPLEEWRSRQGEASRAC